MFKKKAQINRLTNIPQSNDAISFPTVFADENRAVLSYVTDDDEDCIVVFHHCFEFRMGEPAEDSLKGHTRAERGLSGFGAFEVIGSPWMAEVVKRYGKLSDHISEDDHYQHLVFTFKDRCFECITSHFTFEILGEHDNKAERMFQLLYPDYG
jgi:hypothetical protein